VLRTSRPLRAILLVVALLAAPLARAGDGEATRIGGVDVVVWTPPMPVPPRWPVVIFSHGMYMCPTQSTQLTSALAQAGYLVIAPRHSDSSCAASLSADFSRLGVKPSLFWTDRDYRDRAEDIRRVADALPGDPRYADVTAPGELALVGHSLGGYTVLGLAGAWPSWRLPGVRAVVALTPYSLPFQRSEGLRQLAVPVMYQVGALDPVFTLPLESGGYAQTPAPKILVEIAWANHLAWTDMALGNQDAIVDYATAFLDHYVKGAPEAPALHAALPGVASLRRN
jgi:predicted dienelactone hydrolase